MYIYNLLNLLFRSLIRSSHGQLGMAAIESIPAFKDEPWAFTKHPFWTTWASSDNSKDVVRCQDSANSCIKLDRGMACSTGSCCCRHRWCRSSSFRFSRITTSLTLARSCSLRSLKSGAKPLFLCSLFGARGEGMAGSLARRFWNAIKCRYQSNQIT